MPTCKMATSLNYKVAHLFVCESTRVAYLTASYRCGGGQVPVRQGGGLRSLAPALARALARVRTC